MVAPGGEAVTVVERARRYLTKVPPAVSGQGGHDATFRAACVLVIGFGLSEDDAWPLFMEWNATCAPAWSEKDLRRKLAQAWKAREAKGGEIGKLAQTKQTSFSGGAGHLPSSRAAHGEAAPSAPKAPAIRRPSGPGPGWWQRGPLVKSEGWERGVGPVVDVDFDDSFTDELSKTGVETGKTGVESVKKGVGGLKSAGEDVKNGVEISALDRVFGGRGALKGRILALDRTWRGPSGEIANTIFIDSEVAKELPQTIDGMTVTPVDRRGFLQLGRAGK
jgi:hypothetical protein